MSTKENTEQQEYLQSLTNEKTVLDSNLEQLRESVSEDEQSKLDAGELNRRFHQIDAMSVYSEVLGNRIKAIEVTV